VNTLSLSLSSLSLSLSLSVSPLSLSLSLSSLSLSFALSTLMAIFSGEPELAGFIEAKDDGRLEVVLTTGAISHAKLQSNCHHRTFYRPDALPVGKPSVKSLKGKIYANTVNVEIMMKDKVTIMC